MRAHTVSAAAWRDLRGRYEACRKASEELRSRLEAREAELRKLGRIRRQAPFVQDKIRLENEIRGIGDVSGIPQDAKKTLQTAEQDRLFAAQRIDDHEVELNRAKSQRAEISWDASLLLRAEDIDGLYEHWIQLQAARADLPKRVAELDAEEGRLRTLASELGWQTEDVPGLLARIPTRSAVARVRELLKQRTERLAEIKLAQVALQGAEARCAENKLRLAEIEVPADISSFSAVISATKRDFGDIGSRLREAERELVGAKAAVQERFGGLRPRPESAKGAAEACAPRKEKVQDHRDARHSLDGKLADCRERIRSKEAELAARQKERDRIEANEQPVSRRDVIELRARRDSGWDLVRRRHIANQAVSETELRHFTGERATLEGAYENAVREADSAADRSVETASAAARLQQADQSIEKARDDLAPLRDEERDLSKRLKSLEGRWQALWAEAPFEPLEPDDMLAWFDARAGLRQALGSQDESERKLAMLQRHEAGAIEAVASELQLLGIEAGSVRGKGLLVLLELAVSEEQRLRQAQKTRAELKIESRRAASEVAKKREQAERAESATREWKGEWFRAVQALGLPQEVNPDSVEAQVDVIDEMRLVHAEIANLRDKRIVPIRRDIAGFESDLARVVGVVAPGLAGKDPDHAMPELRRLLARSREACEAAQAKNKDISALQTNIRNQEESRRKAREDIFKLQVAAGVGTIEGLKLEIEKAERAKRCASELSEAVQRLRKDGDGLSVEDQQEECLGVDLDEAASREEALRTEIADLRERQLEARDSLRESEDRFHAVGGSDAASIAEGARQNALAEIGEIAGQYIRIRTSALLLEWAIERNLRERQAPMLERAGKLFSELTLGSFEALEMDFDEKDQARLVGRRPSGERVEVDGMSSGSADQLYLALRIAALEDYIDEAQPLPFVADDLFINFDDQRAAAGLKVLERLARRCQVIFFTHHEHLVEVANEAIPESVRICQMTS